jgi:hypothetical protein
MAHGVQAAESLQPIDTYFSITYPLSVFVIERSNTLEIRRFVVASHRSFDLCGG